MKRFGWTNTSLRLSENAEKVYNVTDPLAIYELDDGKTYLMRGAYELDGLTADDVNSILESDIGLLEEGE